MKLQVCSGVITGGSGWYSKEAAHGKTVDVLIDPNRKDYPLAITKANDELFTMLDRIDYVDGRGNRGGDYRGCWVQKNHISLLLENNRSASHLLLQEEEIK